MVRKIFILFTVFTTLIHASLPGRKDINYNNLTYKQLFEKLDIKYLDENLVSEDTLIRRYTYSIKGVFFEKNIPNTRYSLLHWHLRSWCQSNNGIWSSDFEKDPNRYYYGDAVITKEPNIYYQTASSKELDNYKIDNDFGYDKNRFVNVSCKQENSHFAATFDTQIIFVTDTPDLLRARILEKEIQRDEIKKRQEVCENKVIKKEQLIRDSIIRDWRKNLKVGDTIDGINIVINVKGKDLLEIQNRSQHINIWMKRHEIPVPREIERQISDLQKPLQKERIKCRE
ncbi:hypothetical protein [Neisseria sp. HMSC064F03]|uniref:hypothetical protein n=1 Tax=Neisseria sp. HMSC064F03 TaxID=1715037 RepID=UPI0008AA2A15|nr:hypothetical protein [Neisseria sp. HMSC064F03]OHQ15859.1 hypothetical protein HMPREF2557_05425 [Neisseria sp. HMSC064F03]